MSNATTKLKSPKAKVKKNITTTSKALAKDRLIFRVPECAENYFHAIIDPFNVPPGVCIPCDLFPIPSQKTKTFIRGTFNLGTSGTGFFAVNPVLSNDQVCTAYTTSTSVGNAATPFSTFTNTGGSFMAQLPYTNAQLSANRLVKGRIVAAGLRVKYIGKLMDSNGLCASAEDPDHADILSSTWNAITASKYTTVDRITNGSHWDKSVCYSGPVTIQDLEFTNNLYPLASGATFMMIAVQGVANDLFEYEYFQHTEFLGTVVVGKTMSHADAMSYGKALETIKTATIDKPLEPFMAPSLWQKFKYAIQEGLPSLGSGIATTVRSMLEFSPSGIYEGYKGIEKGVAQILQEYSPATATGKQVQARLMLEAPKPPHFVVDRERIPVVLPSYIEVVDDLKITHPLQLKSLGFLPSKEERKTSDENVSV